MRGAVRVIAVVFLFIVACGCGEVERVQVEADAYQEFVRLVKHVRNTNFSVLSADAFREFCIGYCNMLNEGIITRRDRAVLIDYSKPSREERWYILDLVSQSVESSSLVAHGRNTGSNTAKHFANTCNSRKSSLGFFLTAETYVGKHGYSLKLDGLERTLNSNARKRAIVVHGADYVSQEFIKKNGRLGRSWGCPALPKKISKAAIDKVKGGACLYVHGPYIGTRLSSSMRVVRRDTIETFMRLFLKGSPSTVLGSFDQHMSANGTSVASGGGMGLSTMRIGVQGSVSHLV
jgi:hypothetical protein